MTTDPPVPARIEPTPEPRDTSNVLKDFAGWVVRRAKKAGRGVTEPALVAWYTLRDPDTPTPAKGVLAGALAYLVDPIDAIPDLTPLIGYTDDVTLLTAALLIVAASVKPEHRERAHNRVVELFEGPPESPVAPPGETNTDDAAD